MKGDNNNKVIKSFAEIMRAYRSEGTIPADLKEEVFKTIDNIELTADIFDLFTAKFARSEATLLQEFDKHLDVDEGKEPFA